MQAVHDLLLPVDIVVSRAGGSLGDAYGNKGFLRSSARMLVTWGK